VKAPRQIETARLVLSPPAPADAPAIFERYARDTDVTRFLAWPRHQSLADTEAFVAFSEGEWARSPAGPYLIRLRRDGRLLGSTGLAFEAPDRASTGYVLATDAWGQGYATEALAAMVDLARELGVARIHAICHPAHGASARVLEKCGFTLDAAGSRQAAFPNLAPGTLVDALCYAVALQ
jgi:RimJ/RimL family protein N-acetyltransferase